MYSKFTRGLIAAGIVSLTACGGGSNSETAKPGNDVLLSSVTTGTAPAESTRTIQGGTIMAATTAVNPAISTPTAAQASHFLAQASFGPMAASINSVMNTGIDGWLNTQLTSPQTSHRTLLTQYAATLPAGTSVTANDFHASFWKQSIKSSDQLRQRVTYALSQIFVISMADDAIWAHPYGIASYYDTLGQHALGNFRNLLQAVALHPMMGIYLSHMGNQKESATRMPDENFAREIMQLMSIGLYQLNPDGSIKKDAAGNPIETYTHADVIGMSKVFTGWSWTGPDQSWARFVGGVIDPARDWTPMQNYAAYHSTTEKRFLGVSIGTGTTGEADLKVALDTLFNHPNVGPFIGRQLIQRLVSSNPSPAYVGRVAAAFANNGSGVRGDMKAVIKAVLLDPEAMDASTPKKVREPVMRLANWMRAFKATSTSGRFLMGPLNDPIYGLGQSPMASPSVFNFYRPTYTPPDTSLSAAGMVAPEMQITAEPSVTGYVNFMLTAIGWGTGTNIDINADYTEEIAIAAQPERLVDHVNMILLGGTMSSTLRGQILTAVNSIWQPVPSATNAAAVAAARRNRVCLTIFLTMVSPEYLVQR
jgi:uncharacterized protein (DUF1800 family)